MSEQRRKDFIIVLPRRGMFLLVLVTIISHDSCHLIIFSISMISYLDLIDYDWNWI